MEGIVNTIGGYQMALIFCPECGKQVSDLAKACPNCGYPIEEKIQPFKDAKDFGINSSGIITTSNMEQISVKSEKSVNTKKANDTPDGLIWMRVCSFCKRSHTDYNNDSHFCPYCGRSLQPKL